MGSLHQPGFSARPHSFFAAQRQVPEKLFAGGKMQGFRDDVEAIRQNGITQVAFTRLGDPNVIPLWFGEGDLVTPRPVREAAIRALDEGNTFYAHTRGTPELRQGIKTYLDNLYGLNLNIEQITVPGSAMLCVTMAAQLTLTVGSHGLIVSPHWPNIDANFRVTGAEMSYIRQRETASGWQLSAEEIIAATRPNTRAIFINTPCNPTGWVMQKDEMAILLAHCRQAGIVIISDEVYHRNIYDSTRCAPSFLEVAEDGDPVLVVNSFSKAWAMTGWRIGWVVAPSRLAETFSVLAECFNTGATVFAQPGALLALEQGEETINEMQKQYTRNRKMMMDILGKNPSLTLHEPGGAFYGFIQVNGLSSSMKFVKTLLDEEDVGTAPGFTFGPGNEAYFRICFAMSTERLEEGLTRILRFSERHANELSGW